MPKRKCSNRTSAPAHNFTLEPGQSLADFNRLRTLWNKKLANSGLTSVEHIDSRGNISSFFNGYNSPSLAAQYDWSTEEYYRRCGLFLWQADWQVLFNKSDLTINRLLWQHWTDGQGYQFLTDLLVKRAKQLEKRRLSAAKRLRRKRSKLIGQRGPAYLSIWWVHGRIKAIEQVMTDWFRANPEWLDW